MPPIDVILHRPQLSENVGAVARAMRNFGLSHLVLVAPVRYDPARARPLAVDAADLLDRALVVDTLEEAVAPYALVVPTCGRALQGRADPLTPKEAARMLVRRAAQAPVALLLGGEASGLPSDIVNRFAFYSAIPASEELRSLNLAQAALLYGWEVHQQRGAEPLRRPHPPRAGDAPAPMALVTLLRERAKALLLPTGYLNPDAPDRALDELMRMLLRAEPTRREVEMLLAAVAQLARTSSFDS